LPNTFHLPFIDKLFNFFKVSNLRNEIKVMEKSHEENSVKLNDIQSEVDELKRQEAIFKEQINKLKTELSDVDIV